MGDEMKNLNQQILNFDYEQNFKDQDFYVSKSNIYSFKLLRNFSGLSTCSKNCNPVMTSKVSSKLQSLASV